MDEASEVKLHQLLVNVHENALQLQNLGLTFELQSGQVRDTVDPEIEIFATREITAFDTDVVRRLLHNIERSSQDGDIVLHAKVLLLEYSADLLSYELRR